MTDSASPEDSATPADAPEPTPADGGGAMPPSSSIPSPILSNADSVMESVTPNKKLYKLLRNGTYAAYGAFVLGAGATWFSFIGQFGGLNWNWGPLWLLPPLTHVFGFSLQNVEANERGALYWYGECIHELNPGLHFIPASPFAKVVTFVHDTQPIREPEQRDLIFWGDEKEPLPEGLVRPIFMNTRAPTDTETKPLDAQLQVGVSWEIIWVVDDVPTFLQNMHTIKEAEEQIRGMSAPALSEVIAGGTADDAIADQARVNRDFLKRLQELTVNWGVKIRRANITSINLSHDMAKSMRDRAKAEFEAETTRIDAGARADAIRVEGIARGDASRAETSGPLIGRAEGYGMMAKVLKVDGSEVLAAETARETIPGAHATILGEAGLMQAAGIGALFGAGLKAGERRDGEPKKGDKK